MYYQDLARSYTSKKMKKKKIRIEEVCHSTVFHISYAQENYEIFLDNQIELFRACLTLGTNSEI